MCAERVGRLYLVKYDVFMFSLQSHISENIYIHPKNMIEGWWQKQKCDHVSFDRDLHAEGAVYMRKERQLDLESLNTVEEDILWS